MSDLHSISEHEIILSADAIESSLFNNIEYSSQFDKIVFPKASLSFTFSIFYGAISAVGLIYLLIF
jgi:hypothetical protein